MYQCPFCRDFADEVKFNKSGEDLGKNYKYKVKMAVEVYRGDSYQGMLNRNFPVRRLVYCPSCGRKLDV